MLKIWVSGNRVTRVYRILTYSLAAEILKLHVCRFLTIKYKDKKYAQDSETKCLPKTINQIIGNFKFIAGLLVWAGHLFMKAIFTIKSIEDRKYQDLIVIWDKLSR